MNLSGCSKRRVGAFSRTLSPENRLTPFESRPTQALKNPDITDCNVITNSIAAKQYSKNSNLYK